MSAITRFLANQDVDTLQAMRVALRRDIDAAGPEAVTALGERLANTGADWDYYDCDPLLARRIHRTVADHILQDSLLLSGFEHILVRSAIRRPDSQITCPIRTRTCSRCSPTGPTPWGWPTA